MSPNALQLPWNANIILQCISKNIHWTGFSITCVQENFLHQVSIRLTSWKHLALLGQWSVKGKPLVLKGKPQVITLYNVHSFDIVTLPQFTILLQCYNILDV